MKNTLTIGVLIAGLFFVGTVSGQTTRWGITVGSGLGKLTVDESISKFQRNYTQVSGEIGFYVIKEIDPKWTFFVGSTYVRFQSRGVLSVRNPTNRAGIFFGQSSNLPLISDLPNNGNERRNTISYAAFPLLFRLESKKCAFRFGFQPMILSLATTKSEGLKTNIDEIRNYDLGSRFGVDFPLISNVNLYVDYYAGFINVSNNVNAFQRYNRQLLFGLNFNLTKNDN